MLRREALVYEHVAGSFLPAFVGFAEGGARAVLAVEHIDDALWPPPYPDDVSPLFETLDDVARADPPAALPRLEQWPLHWAAVGGDPRPFLRLGVCGRPWLDDVLDRLVAAEAEAGWTGDALVHNDVYSGNTCFRGRHAMLVDWGVAAVGSRWCDVAFAVLSVRSERGGRLPPAVEPPGAPAYAAALAGHFAVEAPKPLPAWAAPGSTLREDMTQDLRAALSWAVETLDLPPLRQTNIRSSLPACGANIEKSLARAPSTASRACRSSGRSTPTPAASIAARSATSVRSSSVRTVPGRRLRVVDPGQGQRRRRPPGRARAPFMGRRHDRDRDGD